MSTTNESNKKKIDLTKKFGIVLGGGGVLGDFQVGALKFLLQYLERHSNATPCVICGTSVGAFNAFGAAQAIRSGYKIDKLEELWNSIMSVEDLYEYENWFNAIRPYLTKVIYGTPVQRFEVIRNIFMRGFFINPGHWFNEIRQDLTKVISGTRVERLEAIRKIIRRFSISPLIGLGGGIFTFVEKALLSTDAFNLSILHQKKIREKFCKYMEEDLNYVYHWEIPLCFAATDLEDGNLAYFSNQNFPQNFAHKRKNVQTIHCQSSLELLNAVFASASFPGIFKPRLLNNKNYVDGSTREIVAFNAAVDYGAELVFVIPSFPIDAAQGSTFPLKQTPISNWRDGNLLHVMWRSLNVVLNEMQINDLIPLRGDPDNVNITPETSVHEITDFDLGLIKINMDYGYMRAFDEIVGREYPSTRNRYNELTRQIIELRVKIYQEEERLKCELLQAKDQPSWRFFSPFRKQADTTILLTIRQFKKILADLVKERVDITKKANIGYESILRPEKLCREWECHDWGSQYNPCVAPFISNPWKRLDFRSRGKQIIDAADPPSCI